MQRFVITPRPTKDGFDLTGPGLPYGLWFKNEFDALNHAHWKLQDSGGKVIVLDSRGWCIIAESATARPSHLPGG